MMNLVRQRPSRQTSSALVRGLIHALILAVVVMAIGTSTLPALAESSEIGAPAAPESQADLSQPLPADVNLRVGETATLDGGSLQVTFVDVREDSRCPKDVMCVWMGRAVVVLHVVVDGVDRGDMPVTLYPRPRSEPSPEIDAIVDRYVISLTDLQPYPDRRQTPPVERVATIHVVSATP